MDVAGWTRKQAQQWAQETYGHAQLGHAARTKRLVSMAASVAMRPAGKVTEAVATSAQREGAYRFLEDEAVAGHAVGQASAWACAQLASGLPVVVVPEDGSSLNLTDTQGSKGSGSIGSKAAGARGFQVMTALGVSEEGVPLGVLAQRIWARSGQAVRKSGGGHDARLLEEKESFEWLAVMEQVLEALAQMDCAALPWFQKDRGADCWQLLQYMGRQQEVLVTVRAAQNRRLQGCQGYLFGVLNHAPVLGRLAVQVPAQSGRPARTARLKVRVRQVRLALRDRRTARRELCTLWALSAREVGPLPQGQKRLCWRLLTNFPVTSYQDACRVLRAYGLRWRVEDFHKTWKSVCRVEESQLHSAQAVEKWARLLADNAMRIERLKHLSRTQPDAPANVELSQEEVDALLILKRPEDFKARRHPSISTAVTLIAELGGYTGKTSSGGPPGSITIGRGLKQLEVAVLTLRAVSGLRKSD